MSYDKIAMHGFVIIHPYNLIKSSQSNWLYTYPKQSLSSFIKTSSNIIIKCLQIRSILCIPHLQIMIYHKKCAWVLLSQSDLQANMGIYNCTNGLFTLSSMVQYSRVWYKIISTVRCSDWYQNSKTYHTSFLELLVSSIY